MSYHSLDDGLEFWAVSFIANALSLRRLTALVNRRVGP